MPTFDELNTIVRTTANYQGFRRRAAFKVEVGSAISEGPGSKQEMYDISRVLDPHLISIQCIDHDAEEEDRCSIELDDREGRLAIPPNGAPINIWLGWMGESLAIVFHGFVDDVESGCARRGGGRRLWIEGKGTSPDGMEAAPMRMNWGDGEGQEIPLQQVLSSAAGNAGLSMKIDPSLANMGRKYWAQQNESFLAFGTRLAQELGGNFKINGNVATLVGAGGGTNAEGAMMPSVVGEWGVNLISWRIKPFVTRPQAQKAVSSFFDKFQGMWGSIDQMIGGQVPFGTANRPASIPSAAPNKVVGEQINQGLSGDSQGERGVGNATINGEPQAKANGRFRVIGARDGVDGIYTIKAAEHTYSRSGGYVTRCELKNPMPDPSGYPKDWHVRYNQDREFEQRQQEAFEAAERMSARRNNQEREPAETAV